MKKTHHHQDMPCLNRREFCKTTLAVGAAVYGSSLFSWAPSSFAQDGSAAPDLVAVRNGEPDVMFDKGIAALGGIGAFVKQGQTVVVKPNIGWDREPETGANTNPLLVKRIVEHCVDAGAKKVYVFDHVINNYLEEKTYEISGVAKAAKDGGAIVAPGNDKKYYQEVEIPGAKRLTNAHVHELLLEADAVINVPVLKHHFASQVTIAMKNLMGVVWDRMAYHGKGLHDCIADFCLFHKPTLNVVDAYVVTMANGPQRARPQDLEMKKNLLISTDIVAIDAAAAKIFGIEPEKVQYIKLAAEKNLGTMNLDSLNIKKIVI